MATRRRLFQFSLRTAFIAVTIFAVWLGENAQRTRRQREAADAIRLHGGIVIYNWEMDAVFGHRDLSAKCPLPDWLRESLGDDWLFKVAGVSFGSGSSDADLAILQNFDLDEITFLWLGNTAVSDEGIKRLPEMRNLKSLCLNGTRITDFGLSSLQRYRELLALRLDDTEVTDAGLTSLYELKHLHSLALRNTKIHYGRERVHEHLPKCEQD